MKSPVVPPVSSKYLEAILEKVKTQSKEKVKGGVDVKPHHVRPRKSPCVAGEKCRLTLETYEKRWKDPKW